MIVQTASRLNHINEYYFSRKLSEIRELNETGEDIINLGIGNPDLNPDDVVISELRKTAISDSVHGYQPYRSIPELREAFSLWYREQFNTHINPVGEILPLMGSKEGILHISMAFLNQGDGVLIPDPGYPAYEAAAKLVGARTVFFNLKESNSWLPDYTELSSADLEGVKLMWVNYPNMPTGRRPDKDTFKELILFARKNNIIVVNDNPYSLILNPEPTSILSEEGALDTAIELNSLSKSHNMAGWRIGMVAASERNISSILKVKSNMNSGMFLPLQKAAVKALQLPPEWYLELNQKYRARRELVHEILDTLGLTYSTEQSGLFIWSKLPDSWNSSYDYSDQLLKTRRVFITPGSVFGTMGRKYMRTSLCVNEQRLSETLKRIK